MSNISKKALKEVIGYYENHGEYKTLKEFGILPRTLKRYICKHKSLNPRVPKILLFDIESSPLTCYTWQVGDVFIPHGFIIEPTAMLTWSAKWLCDSKIMSMQVTPTDAKRRTDKKIVEALWQLFDEADILIAHNLKGFDYKYCNTRFLLNGMLPPSPYQMIDTLPHCRKHFRFARNKLDYVTKFLDISQKKETNMQLWINCVNGDRAAISYMKQYNEQDVRALEDLYLIIRPYMSSHPNLAPYYENMGDRCTRCGSNNLSEKRDKDYYTTSGRFIAVRCNHCGAFSRERTNDLTKEDKKRLLRPIAR